MPYKDPVKARESARLRQKKYREKNKEKLNSACLARYHKVLKNSEEHKKERREYLKDWRAKNQDSIKAYRANASEAQKEKSRARASKWQKVNVAKSREKNTFHKPRVFKATPKWIDRGKLLEFYISATELEKVSGVKYHVDHIVPLVHKDVCGLHVPWNLQIITAKANIKKSNQFEIIDYSTYNF